MIFSICWIYKRSRCSVFAYHSCKWTMNTLTWSLTKADPATARRGCAPPPPFGIFGGFVFVNFDWITRVYFNWSHQTIFTMCTGTLFSPITTKHRASVKGVSKQTSDPKNSTPPRPCLLVLKFLDLPLTVLSTATVHVL